MQGDKAKHLLYCPCVPADDTNYYINSEIDVIGKLFLMNFLI